ncbi:MAG: arginine decarboxylase, pyruvoyl-dependent [Methanocorpusculum sp.]|nr:arginine decarboxylase, pyruvoyl-dependent [Methanocorpusculum sp.]
MVVPSKVFFTKGVGYHEERLVSFEMALRDAGIAPFNLVYVSSIMPPDADIVPRDEGLKYLSPGEIVYCVMARESLNKAGEKIAASIGLAVPQIHTKQHGYLSEHHCEGMSADECAVRAEKMAAIMLGTIMHIDVNPELDWNEQEKAYLASGKIIKTSNISEEAVCRDGVWTTVISAAVFVC